MEKFIAGSDGRLTALLAVAVRWEKDAAGNPLAVTQPGSERLLPAQLALLAMGFHGPEQPLLKTLSVATDVRGNALADRESYMTSARGVFAAGDCRRGQSLVVWAINEGRGAARECDRYLSGAGPAALKPTTEGPLCVDCAFTDIPQHHHREQRSMRQAATRCQAEAHGERTAGAASFITMK